MIPTSGSQEATVFFYGRDVRRRDASLMTKQNDTQRCHGCPDVSHSVQVVRLEASLASSTSREDHLRGELADAARREGATREQHARALAEVGLGRENRGAEKKGPSGRNMTSADRKLTGVRTRYTRRAEKSYVDAVFDPSGLASALDSGYK